MKKQFLVLGLFWLFFINAFAELNILEKSYDITRKARKGYLGAVETNKEKNTFDLIYILKSNNRKIITETYTYDKDLNLVNTVKDEQDVEKVRSRYKWFRYRGEEYSVNSIYVRSNAKGEMIFRQKTILYKWSWWRGGYAKKIKLGDKIKPVDEESGARYMFRGGYYENDNSGKLVVVAGLKDGKDNISSYKNYQVLEIDSLANIKVKADIKFNAAYAPVFSDIVDDDDPTSQDESPRDWIVVFAPQGGKSFKGATGTANDFIYVRMSPDGSIKEQYNFTAPVAGWRILGATEKNGQVYLYGPSISKDDRFINEVFKGQMLANTTNEDAHEDNATNNTGGFFGGGLGSFGKSIKNMATGEAFQVTQDDIDKRMDEMKYTNVQVAAFNSGKLQFISSPTIDEINANLIVPTGQKKAIEFDGKRFITTGIYVTNNGDIFICGQDYKLDGWGKDNKGSRLYKAMFMVQFNAQGKYLRNYGLKLDQKKYMGGFTKGVTPDMYPAYSYLEESVDGKKLYWMLNICKAIDKDVDYDSDYNFFSGVKTTTTTSTFTPLNSIEYGTIDVATGATSDFKTLGEDENRKFYLMDNVNKVRLNPYLIYLSETTKGDKILLSRFDISQ
ncbi:MAG TPA: hypothetical protein PKO18_06710 [Chitinophagales bacterium]|nr:hypothetical protein [Chitinophagales bacterium]HNL84910.1 hypothetical protein [Chitinophagales bacterium]